MTHEQEAHQHQTGAFPADMGQPHRLMGGEGSVGPAVQADEEPLYVNAKQVKKEKARNRARVTHRTHFKRSLAIEANIKRHVCFVAYFC